MSDELIFDSERQALRDRKKRWLVPLLVLVGILLAVVVVSLLLRSGKKPVNKGGEDTLYPFTWQVQADGSVLLELPHSRPSWWNSLLLPLAIFSYLKAVML